MTTDEIQTDDNLNLDEFSELDLEAAESSHTPPSEMPLFRALFAEVVAGDSVLEDFAEHVVGALSNHFALKAAKGGAFFQERVAEGMKNTERFQRDQTMRAHLINGMLPALHIARLLARWGTRALEDWDETSERLFIVGYMLHDYSKIDDVQATLRKHGFWDGEAPSERQVPVLEAVFREWCGHLGLDAFLQPVGGAEPYLQDLIYIASNTQRLKGTFRLPAALPNKTLDVDMLDTLTELSRFADLVAYVAPTPRALVSHEGVRKVIAQELAFDDDLGQPVGRLVYHHVAENRGLLLNLIHNAVIEAMTVEDMRVPLLYAPSGVVYLERYDTPPPPDVDTLATHIAVSIRQKAGDRLLRTGKGAKRGNTFMQIDDSYNDFFSLPEMISNSMKLISRYIRSNKTPARFEAMEKYEWTGWDNLPDNVPTDPEDARVDQIAEWAGFVETQFRDRFDKDTTTIVEWLLDELGIRDLADDFFVLKGEATRGGLRYWWHWGAAHALARQGAMDDVEVQQWLHGLSLKLVAELPDELPAKAQVDPQTWADIESYIRRVLTIRGDKSASSVESDELSQYINAKTRRGQAVCAICGSDYVTRTPSETAVAFQPGVFTQRLNLGASNNKRYLCSICATEQLLQQLFLDNLDKGSKAESQRIRYLSFYPSYFFSPETLRIVRRAYNQMKSVRLSDSDLRRALTRQPDLRDASFWQTLDVFFLRPLGEADESKFQRVLTYADDAQSTYFTAGFRNIDPTETESWVVPSFLALVMSVCLDVKVVASDSGIPLMLEASELPETLWFDGAHPAVQNVLQHERLNIDQVGMALARLTAAYLIHLDTEYAPPKENWQRFSPIANALCESPLYVFHYLKKQERDGNPITQSKVRRYVHYAQLFTQEGDQDMSHARELVILYRGFYRAKTIKNANSILRPLSVISDALLVADPRLFHDADSLVEVAHGELYRFMDRVGKGLADGRFPKGIKAEERRQAMRDFCVYFVNEIFLGAFNGDVAALRGKQLNLLKSACEVIYRDAQLQEWAEREPDPDEIEDPNDED